DSSIKGKLGFLIQWVANIFNLWSRVSSIGGIIGIGEGGRDRVGLLHTLATLLESTGSVLIHALLGVKILPLEDQKTDSCKGDDDE
ncbi:hypothetical protein C5167_020658, partial [Papaver somniferum]